MISYVVTNFKEEKRVMGWAAYIITDVLSKIPPEQQKESWFVEWKRRLENKTEFQKELDQKLWNACRSYNWREAEKLINQGATSDFISGYSNNAYYGGLNAYWIMFFENQNHLRKLLDEKFQEAYKSFLFVAYYQLILIQKNLELNKKYFKCKELRKKQQRFTTDIN